MGYLILILAFVLGIVGAVSYRWRGMDANDVPTIIKSRLVRRLVFASVLGMAAIFAGGNILPIVEGNNWFVFPDFLGLKWLVDDIAVFVAAIILSFYGIIVGHGSYFAGGGPKEDNEVFSFITKEISSPMNEMTKFVGMALTGVTVTCLLALIPGIAWWYAAVGILKAVVYFGAYAIRKILPVGETEVAEFGWGFVAVFILTLA